MTTLANMGRFGPGGHFLPGPWIAGRILLWIALLGLLTYIAVLLARRSGGGPMATGPAGPPPAAGTLTPLEAAKLRYAKGELSRDEYEALKKDLE